MEARHPDRFTATGTARWRGRIYDSFPAPLHRQRIFIPGKRTDAVEISVCVGHGEFSSGPEGVGVKTSISGANPLGDPPALPRQPKFDNSGSAP